MAEQTREGFETPSQHVVAEITLRNAGLSGDTLDAADCKPVNAVNNRRLGSHSKRDIGKGMRAALG
jgi:hypothetical protein